MSASNIFELKGQETQEPVIQDGDAVMIIRPNGDVVTMTVGIDQKKLDTAMAKGGVDLTEDERNLLLQGQTLFLLSMAAGSVEVMNFLVKLSAMPGGPTYDNMKAATRLN